MTRAQRIEEAAHALMACMIRQKREGMKFWSVDDEDALDALRAALALTPEGDIRAPLSVSETHAYNAGYRNGAADARDAALARVGVLERQGPEDCAGCRSSGLVINDATARIAALESVLRAIYEADGDPIELARAALSSPPPHACVCGRPHEACEVCGATMRCGALVWCSTCTPTSDDASPPPHDATKEDR